MSDEKLTRKALDELLRLAELGVEESREFHFEKSAQVGVSPFVLVSLIELAREGLAARERAIAEHSEYFSGLNKTLDEMRAARAAEGSDL